MKKTWEPNGDVKLVAAREPYRVTCGLCRADITGHRGHCDHADLLLDMKHRLAELEAEVARLRDAREVPHE